ncbi:hypothetical protein NX059_005871 [Plenodomus lindquistii]|nr:hypothetical protein NX059_005871 [Plenodomus lindquistii]
MPPPPPHKKHYRRKQKCATYPTTDSTASLAVDPVDVLSVFVVLTAIDTDVKATDVEATDVEATGVIVLALTDTDPFTALGSVKTVLSVEQLRYPSASLSQQYRASLP